MRLPHLIDAPKQVGFIPRLVHFIWIGDAPLPTMLAQRIIQNAARCPGFQCRLYIEASDPVAQQRLANCFPPASGITLVDLQCDARFQAFLETPLGRFYRHFASPAGNNYSAASDILRAYLLHRDGGLYMDVDDSISRPVSADYELTAGSDDVLLNRMVTVKEYDFSGYPSSNFACQPGNPVLAAWLEEMTHRLGRATEFLKRPRPWEHINGADRSYLLEYITTIFHLVGPGVFNEVLRTCRPDHYYIERDLLTAYRITTISPAEPRYVVERYFNAMHAAKAYYLPFAEPTFDIEIGSAHSWNLPVSADRCG
ncbi:hypothetical protein WI75_25500 [Burkholderia ubonensis]|nr:hypothetical protein WI75_25500 [Burkholderia ubonensis]